MRMFQAAVVVCALAAPAAANETVLLDFTASWCGPCRQMTPMVDRLAAEGIPVRKVDIDSEKALAQKFRVTGVPCFVMMAGGRETGRIVGLTSYEELRKLVAAAGAGAKSQADGSSTIVAPNSPPQITPELVERLIAASVRIEIHDGTGQSVGSGTIIDSREGEALVLTCGHIFRDSKGQGRIAVDLQCRGAPQDLPGRIVGYDLESDVGLVSFRPGVPVTVARVAAPGYRARPNEPVVSVGCNHGDDATARVSRVTTVDKFLGTPNLQVAGQPVQGRSGGGLFNAAGNVIGVCNAADPEDDEGLYAALPAVHAELNQFGLARFCLPEDPIVASAPPQMPTRMPAFGSADPTVGTIATMSTVSAPTVNLAATLPTNIVPVQATAAEMRAPPSFAAAADLGDLSAGAEVVCIVRPLADPRAKSKVVVIDYASPDLLQQLADDHQRQQSRALTSYDTPSRTEEPMTGWQPSWRKVQKPR